MARHRAPETEPATPGGETVRLQACVDRAQHIADTALAANSRNRPLVDALLDIKNALKGP